MLSCNLTILIISIISFPLDIIIFLSLSDNPKLLGRPSGFTVTVRDLKPSLGAGFIVALSGDIMTMPGLPKVPAANNMDVVDGKTVGLF